MNKAERRLVFLHKILARNKAYLYNDGIFKQVFFKKIANLVIKTGKSL